MHSKQHTNKAGRGTFNGTRVWRSPLVHRLPGVDVNVRTKADLDGAREAWWNDEVETHLTPRITGLIKGNQWLIVP